MARANGAPATPLRLRLANPNHRTQEKDMSTSTSDSTGVLFKNDRKERDSQPDYTGRITIDGTEYRLSAWINEAQQTGRKYLRLRATPIDSQPVTPTVSNPPSSMSDLALAATRQHRAETATTHNLKATLDDDIPF